MIRHKRSLRRRDGITLPASKVCPRCSAEKKANEFHKRKSPSGNVVLSSYCKDCNINYNLMWYANRSLKRRKK